MRHSALFLIVPLVAVAACGHKTHEETRTTVTKDGVTTTTVTRRVVDRDRDRDRDDDRGGDRGDDKAALGLNIDSDKFKANLELPGMSFGGDDMDMGGMKLYPGSKVRGMSVHAVDRGGQGKGEVVIEFTSPATPLAVAQHMAGQARTAGFKLASNTSALISGSKTDEDGDAHNFAAALRPDGTATAGKLTITGSKSDAD